MTSQDCDDRAGIFLSEKSPCLILDLDCGMDSHWSFFNEFLVLQWFRADPRVRPTPLGGPLQAISDGQAKVRPTSAGGG